MTEFRSHGLVTSCLEIGTLDRLPPPIAGEVSDEVRHNDLVSCASAGWSNEIGAKFGLGSLMPTTDMSGIPYNQDGDFPLVGISIVAILWILFTFWFIHRYAVNTVLYDNWSDVRLIGRANAGALSFGDLWAQHGENRIFLPNLIALGLAHSVRFNIVDEDYLSGLLLALTAILLIFAHHRRSPSTPWLYYIPVVVTVLSLNQGTMDLFGFALSWYLEICALSVALFLLDREVLGWPIFVGAAAAGIGGSLSSLEGLLIWPVGLLLLYHRSRPRPIVIAWIAIAAASIILYFYRFNFGATDSDTYDFHHPLEALRFFFFSIGNVLGIAIPNSPTLGDYAVLAFGAVVFLVACWILIIGLPRPAEQTGASIGVGLVVFGVLYTISLTIGRAGSGLVALPRYSIFDLILLAGCYLAIVDGSLFSRSRWRDETQGYHAARSHIHPRHGKPLPGILATRRSAMQTSFLLVLIGLIFIQIGIGTREAFSAADSWHAHELAAADITANISTAPDGLVHRNLGSAFESAQFIRAETDVAKVNHLSLFGTALAPQLEHQGLTVGRTPPITYIVRPTYGSTVKGQVFLDALATEPYGIGRVEFTIASESGDSSTVLGLGSESLYGWIFLWNSASVPNGRYLLRSKAYDTIGTSSRSVGVAITVKN